MTLKKSDVQKFMKRLRSRAKENEKKGLALRGQTKHEKIKYYIVGEYGDQRKRPHYHAIIFNSNPQDIKKSWTLGHVDIGEVNAKTVRYTLKYMDKGNKTTPYHFEAWDGIKQFSLQSKGLGENYLTTSMIKWHKEDPNRNYLITPEGYKIAMPRYYKDRIWTTDEEKRMLLQHIQQKIKAEQREQNAQHIRNNHKFDYNQLRDMQRYSRYHQANTRRKARTKDG